MANGEGDLVEQPQAAPSNDAIPLPRAAARKRPRLEDMWNMYDGSVEPRPKRAAGVIAAQQIRTQQTSTTKTASRPKITPTPAASSPNINPMNLPPTPPQTPPVTPTRKRVSRARAELNSYKKRRNRRNHRSNEKFRPEPVMSEWEGLGKGSYHKVDGTAQLTFPQIRHKSNGMILSPGECIRVNVTPDSLNVAKITHFSMNSYGLILVHIVWYYTGSQIAEGRKDNFTRFVLGLMTPDALLISDHRDVISADAIECPTAVLSPQQYLETLQELNRYYDEKARLSPAELSVQHIRDDDLPLYSLNFKYNSTKQIVQGFRVKQRKAKKQVVLKPIVRLHAKKDDLFTAAPRYHRDTPECTKLFPNIIPHDQLPVCQN